MSASDQPNIRNSYQCESSINGMGTLAMHHCGDVSCQWHEYTSNWWDVCGIYRDWDSILQCWNIYHLNALLKSLFFFSSLLDLIIRIMSQEEKTEIKAEESSWHEAPTQGEPVNPQSRKVIVVLENASLEAARLNAYRHDSKMQLLNCDEHQSILKRLGRDIADARPDIVHQVSCYWSVCTFTYSHSCSVSWLFWIVLWTNQVI